MVGGGTIEFSESPTFVWDPNYECESVNVRFIKEVELMHSCTETNTFVLACPTSRRKDDTISNELMWNLMHLNETPLPFGQIVFLSYHSDGEFLLEAGTERFKPHLIEQAFISFGYKEAKLVGEILSVSEKDEFQLKLKYGR